MGKAIQLAEMERRFPHDQRQMMLGQNLVPSKLANLNDTIQDELKNFIHFSQATPIFAPERHFCCNQLKET